jgi:hypothetical protein
MEHQCDTHLALQLPPRAVLRQPPQRRGHGVLAHGPFQLGRAAGVVGVVGPRGRYACWKGGVQAARGQSVHV